jgi:hypothetical protein
MVDRYEIDCPRCGVETSVDVDGDWVLFTDHEAELTALREQLATAEKRAMAWESKVVSEYERGLEEGTSCQAILEIQGRERFMADYHDELLAELTAKQKGGA